MAEQIGIVIEKETGPYARVVTDRKGGCGGCHSSSHSCRSCLSSAKLESRVANPVDAEAGDLVRIHLSSGNLYLGAAILYLLPIFGILLGAFTGNWLATAYGLAETVGTVGGAAAGLAFGFAAVIILDRTAGLRRRLVPTITTILTPHADTPDNKGAPCCG